VIRICSFKDHLLYISVIPKVHTIHMCKFHSINLLITELKTLKEEFCGGKYTGDLGIWVEDTLSQKLKNISKASVVILNVFLRNIVILASSFCHDHKKNVVNFC
jgi:hypothetical protein